MAPRPREVARLAVVIGTRPEALKLAPVIDELRRRALPASVVFSGQHDRLVSSIADEIGLVADLTLDTDAAEAQSLSAGLAGLMVRLDHAFASSPPRGVVVQGDTNTALGAALVAFHRQLPVFHVEAGLRTASPAVPFPEEMNRRLVARLATRHYAPTESGRQNLLGEGVRAEAIRVTGNPIVDTLRAHEHAARDAAAPLLARAPGRLHVLVTLHRRENAALAGQIAEAVSRLCAIPDVDILWVTHPNPTGARATQQLQKAQRVLLLDPQPYRRFLGLMQAATVVLTDSGGVQEEAPALGVPVLVLRTATERPEGVTTGNCRIVAPEADAIVQAATEVLTNDAVRAAMSNPVNPYGDGRAAARIVDDIDAFYAGT